MVRRADVERLEARALLAAAGLVAAYSFDEGSGTVLRDVSGAGNNGTIVGPTWNASGRFGQALSFNGTSDIVNVADSNSLDLTTGMTLEAWAKPSLLSGYRTILMKDVPGELSYSLYASGDVNRPNAWARTNNTSFGVNGSAALPANTWSHVATTYDGVTLRIFVNGAQTGSRAVTGALQTSANPLHLGANAVWGEYFRGLLDEVRIYNRALTAAEIQSDMNTAVATPDTAAPTVSLTAPAPGAIVLGTATVAASASDNVGVVGVQFQLDGVNFGAEDTTAPYSVSWNTTGAADGLHTLTAVARDAAGNSATSPAVGVTVQNTDSVAPSVSLSAPVDGAVLAGTVSVTANASDDRGVIGVQFLLNGNSLGAEDTVAPYTVPWDTLAGLNGAYALAARARDTAGNATTSAPVNVTVYNAGKLVIDAPVNGATINGTTIDVRYHAVGDQTGVDHVHFSLDGQPEVMDFPMDGVYQFTNVAAGSHVINGWLVKADHTKIPGTDASPVSVTTNSGDTQAPAVSVTAPAAGATVTGAAVQVTASASDNVGVLGVQFLLDGNALGAEDLAAPYATAWDSTIVANGAHVLSARARDAAGNVTTSVGVSVTVSNSTTNPAVVGQWSPVMNWPLVAINMVLLKTGKVLMWDGGPDCIGATSATLWDPATNTFTPVPSETRPDVRDIFCSAQTVLADGRVLVVGGHECVDPSYVGSAIASIFDPATQTWTRLPDMTYRRWYPTATTLPDGRALVTAGSDTGNVTYIPIPEVYDPVSNTFTKLTAASLTVPNYPFMFVLPDGRVLEAGSDEATAATRVLDVATQTWTTVDARLLDGGSAVMYRPGKVMKSGSWYYADTTAFDSNPAVATTYTIDMTQPAPAWQQTASMASGRAHHNLTVLPDGNVLATGGSRDLGGWNPASAVYPAELWSPATQTWTTMASMATPRMYHSTAMLMPDGRILSAGGGHNYVNNANYFSAEYYSPPYLFKGARPTITSSPELLKYNTDFFVGTPDGSRIASVSLVCNGAVTHQVNMDQRFVPLSFSQTAGGLNVHAPADANLAPPGYYMLFIVDTNGVPSVAPFVRLPAAYEDTQAPTAPTGLAATGAVGSATLNWAAATDNTAVSRYNVYRSTTSGFTPGASTLVGSTTSTTFTDSGLAAGTYYFRVTAQDAAGNVSPASNEAVAMVSADSTAPSVALTAPSSGATVSGTVTLTASASDNVGVAGVQFLLDGGLVGAEDTSAPFSMTWNTATTANGSHTLTARARDAAGNMTTSAPVTVTVSNAAPTGLVASYNFNEGSGSTLGDSSGNNFNGTVANATWATGHSGGALSFNGTNSWVTIPDANALDFTTGMTIEAWVMPRSLTGWQAIVIKERTGGLAYALYSSDDTNRPPAGYVNVGGSDRSAAGTAALPLNTWTHLATTYDGASLRLYVNGTLVRTSAFSGSIITSTGVLRIGGDSVWGEYFNGSIDDVRLYNRALAQTQIQADMSPPATSAAAPATSLLMAAPSGTVTTDAAPADRASTLVTSDGGATKSASTLAIIDRLRALRLRRAPFSIRRLISFG